MADDPIILNTTEARGGSRGKTIRTIMIVSIVLVVAAFVAIYMFYG